MLVSPRRPPRRGGAAAWFVLCLAVLLGVMALAMDGGRMMDERQQVQAAADAAALAAAADLYENYPLNAGLDPAGTAKAAALNTAAANGYANDGKASTVTVNIPPLSGPFAGKADHAEVVVQSNLDAGFGRVFNSDTLPVRARAVARGRRKKVGIYVLRPTGAASLLTSSTGSLQAVNATVVVNSTDPAAYTNKSNDVVKAESFEIAGGLHNTGAALIGPVHTGVAPTPDPLRGLPPPDTGSLPVRSTTRLSVGTGPVTLSPGIYQGGIDVKGATTVTLQAGTYVLDGGGLKMTTSSSLAGTGVLIYNTGGAAAGPIDLTAAEIALTPPSDGAHAGINIFQARDVTATVTIAANSNAHVGGAIYAPAGAVVVSGTGSSTSFARGGGFIAWTMSVGGNGSLVVDPGSNRPRLPDVRLVD